MMDENLLTFKNKNILINMNCEKCNKNFKSINYLKRHQEKIPNCIFKCDGCLEIFSNNFNLKKHQKRRCNNNINNNITNEVKEINEVKEVTEEEYYLKLFREREQHRLIESIYDDIYLYMLIISRMDDKEREEMSKRFQ